MLFVFVLKWIEPLLQKKQISLFAFSCTCFKKTTNNIGVGSRDSTWISKAIISDSPFKSLVDKNNMTGMR